jgi:hypothetical protein
MNVVSTQHYFIIYIIYVSMSSTFLITTAEYRLNLLAADVRWSRGGNELLTTTNTTTTTTIVITFGHHQHKH